MSELATLPRDDKSLRRTLRDLVAISSLQELWLHRSSEEIARSMAGILVNTLYLRFVYVCFKSGSGDIEIEVAHVSNGSLDQEQTGALGDRLAAALETNGIESRFVTEDPLNGKELRAFSIPVGPSTAHGYVVAASREPQFPGEFDEQLLRVAINQVFGILRQKQIEAELRKKQEDLTDFFENATEGLHWVGPDGIIIWANQAELDMLGYEREEYIGHHFSEFYIDKVLADDVLERLVANEPVHNYEVRLRRKDGSTRNVVINSSVYRENGDFIHTRCFTRDITERKRMEEELRRAHDDLEMRVQQRTRELSAAIDALRKEIEVREQVEAEVTELRGRLSASREAERLFLAQELHDGAIQDLLAISYELSNLPQGGVENVESLREAISEVTRTLRNLSEELRPSTLISSGLEEAIHTHLAQFRKQNPRYEVEVDLDPDGTILPERTRLALYRIYQQALANVVRHANADQVQIACRIADGYATLEIQDNGQGFTVQGNWIELARQGHLGLIGSVERAQMVGGELTVESEPGRGTRIQARVPVHDRLNPPRRSAAASAG